MEGEVVMEGVEHLGQYVFEMTKTRMERMVLEGGEEGPSVEEVVDEEEEGEEEVLRDGDEDEGDGEVRSDDAGDEEE